VVSDILSIRSANSYSCRAMQVQVVGFRGVRVGVQSYVRLLASEVNYELRIAN